MGTSRLQATASQYVERAAYAAAVPYLAELNRRLWESEDATAVRARENVLYFLGLGRLQSAELPLAAATFAEFVSLYPDSANVTRARFYGADCFYYQGRPGDARSLYAEVVSGGGMMGLGGAERLALWERYADCLYVERDWENADAVFAGFAEALDATVADSGHEEKRGKAASYRLQSAMAQNQFEGFMSCSKERKDSQINLIPLQDVARAATVPIWEPLQQSARYFYWFLI